MPGASLISNFVTVPCNNVPLPFGFSEAGGRINDALP